MSITKKDVIWAYAAQFFQISTGILVLPLILRMLNTNEIAMNYVMLNIGSMVTLFDFGFSGQFSRNISYVFSGVQELKKDGVVTVPENSSINYRLLKVLISTSKIVYRILSMIVLLIMLTAGTLYIYKVTDEFVLVSNALIIWVLYTISVFFNIYYMYLNPLLLGKRAIAESKKTIVYSRIAYLFIAYILLFLKLGLISVVIANIISPFIQRLLSLKYFYTNSLKLELKKINVSKDDFKYYFNLIWYNAKKIGLVMVGSFAITKSGMFFAGLFLSTNEIASYGLMLQLVNIIIGVSTTMFVIHQPQFAGYRINNDIKVLIKDFSLTMGVFYLLFVFLSILLIFFGNPLLALIKSNSLLPNRNLLVLYLIIILLEQNHSCFSTIIASKNTVPYVKSSLLAGFFIISGSFLILKYTQLGLFGMILIQGIVQLAYANWKWPKVVCNEMEMTFDFFLYKSYLETIEYCKRGINGINRFFQK